MAAFGGRRELGVRSLLPGVTTLVSGHIAVSESLPDPACHGMLNPKRPNRSRWENVIPARFSDTVAIRDSKNYDGLKLLPPNDFRNLA
ncbi:hypothetical protein [Actinomadura sp. 7K507]|uniref:hypothetical protein n=1 Tax=Actinomadura sp. 7K507 TaxID=2530365 RepID=UPI00104A0DBE|nr:hypothetical protein [Actinomadura sp. 7K507]TDC90218.1 hypothetical protein E1285_15110 [Actinomadura sp. 7K507]